MKRMQKCLVALLAACLLLATAPLTATADAPSAGEECVIGRLMPEGAVREYEAGKTFLGGTIEAAVPVNVRDCEKADLAVRFSYRITRSDGVTGPGSLSRLRNGYVDITDSAGTQLARFGSPTQNAVAGDKREAGQWLDVSYSLASMKDGSGRIASVKLGDYNDFPNRKDDGSFEFSDGGDITLYMEVRDLRIVDTTKYADGTPIPRYTVTTFNGISGVHPAFNASQWYADWKYADVYPVSLEGDRHRYRLQMTLAFSSSDPSVDLDRCWSSLYVKLRSSDVTGKPGDPGGASNSEHNAGWDFTPANLPTENGVARLSIDLGSIPTNSRGLMDWSDVRRMIAVAGVSNEYKSRIGDITMTLSDVQIVDLTAVSDLRAALKGVMDDSTAPSGDADKAVYDAALAEANALYADETATVAALQAAMAALKAARAATAADKAALLSLLEDEIDPAGYTADTAEVYLLARQTAQQAADTDGTTVAAVNTAYSALKEARYALVPDRSPHWGDVDLQAGVTAADALLALQAATGKIALSPDQTARADVDGVTGVTAADALLILQYATGKITAFPVGGDLSSMTEAMISADPLTFCNPINLNYQYQADYNGSREAADPAVVVFKGEYWLFASHNDGYWHSPDLYDWTFVPVNVNDPVQSEFKKFAPATMVIGDTLYVTHSQSGAFLKTTNPADPGAWVSLGKPYQGYEWGDPAWLYDDPADGGDGYVYAVQGTSPTAPIVVMKFDPNDNMKMVAGPVECVRMDLANHGWEISGDNNTNYTGRPFLEGGWLNKYDGKYYLTYALPGTADASYADGCCVADDPMGPYTYCAHSPVIRKASGFVRGAGHGCLFEDMDGHWWKVDTVALSVNTGFERRLAIFPAIFDDEGDLYANTVLGDYPLYRPTKSDDPFFATGPEWSLLSLGKQATASSILSRQHAPAKATEENMRTWWSAATGDVGEWLQVDLGDVYGVWSVQVNFADQDTVDNPNRRQGDFSYKYRLEFSQDGETWYPIVDRTENDSETSHDYYEFAQKIGARYFRVTNTGAVPQGGKFAVSGLRVFGDPVGALPGEVEDFTVERYPEDERTASVSWDPVPGAQGYIIRFGTEEDQLYNHQQVIGDNGFTLHCLNRGVDYYFTVDSYGEGGVTKGTTVKKAPWTVDPAIPDDPGPDDPDPDDPGPDDPGPTTGPVKVDGYPVYEAEAAQVENANVSNDAPASGGKTIHNMHNAGAAVTFTGVASPGATAILKVTYSNGNAGVSGCGVIVNGQTLPDISLPVTANWNTFVTVDVPLSGLTADGGNTVRLEGRNAGFNLDYIQLVPAA
ncbi:MAG: family 43 glycosylhydrolase [Acutalibacteraceae bacterium]|jgi:xylan 1,4-beta-xylosidase